MLKVDHEAKKATLYLRDYLQPGGLHPYDNLPADLEHWLKQGYEVSLISVPGFQMLYGNPKYEKPWGVRSMGKFYTFKTARAALEW